MSQIITPSNPINGQEIVVNGTVLVYVEAEQVWRVQIETAGDLSNKLNKPSGDPLLATSVVQVATNGGVSYVQLSDKQDNLTADQQAVVDANPFTTADETKLDGIADSANNFSLTGPQQLVVDANAFTAADESKLDGIAESANNFSLTGPQQLVVDANAFTDADEAKLDGIADSANNFSLTDDQQLVVNANAFTDADETKLDGLTQYTDALARTAVGPIPTQYTDDLARTAVGTIPTQYTDDLARTAVGTIPTQYTDDLARTAVGAIPTQYTDDLARTAVGTIPSQYTDDLARTATGVSATPTSVTYVDAGGDSQTVNLEAGGVTPHNPRVSIREVNDLDGSNQELVLPNTASELIDVDVTVGPTGDFTFLDMHTFSASGTNTITFDDARPQRFIVNVPANPTEAITVHYTLRYRDESTMAIHSVMRVYTIQVGFIWCFGVSSSLPNGLINTGQGILRLGEVVTRTTTADADKFWGAVNTDQFENFRLSSGSVFVDFYETDPETGLQYPDVTIGGVVFRQFQIERGSSLGSLTVTVTGV